MALPDTLSQPAVDSPLVWSAVVYMGLVMTALGYGIWYHLPVHFVADLSQVTRGQQRPGAGTVWKFSDGRSLIARE